MPKKAAVKADPETLKKMFEEWKQSPEAKLWDELVEFIKENRSDAGLDAEFIEDDFIVNFKLFFYKLQQLFDMIKVPKRPKSIFTFKPYLILEACDQEVIRTLYIDNRSESYVCNGRKIEMEREIKQDSYNLMKTLKELIQIIKKKTEINETDYTSIFYVGYYI